MITTYFCKGDVSISLLALAIILLSALMHACLYSRFDNDGVHSCQLVAPVREISILIGAVMGAYLLKEGFGARRIIASVIMVIGVVAVALS